MPLHPWHVFDLTSGLQGQPSPKIPGFRELQFLSLPFLLLTFS
jgi:hypothetical protein